ncbi:hypothetical protein BDN72DRAFT_782587 [Pluteus cervinus]|uniref:Uncharacterized protein n=1 Tax=Pluteus cervinus TaxID=181527 RepID=A0ACD2ZZG2_9AGAR|nr:hypothetical protein BDN72DRAFT_782587 [Pluteus cervinus]
MRNLSLKSGLVKNLRVLVVGTGQRLIAVRTLNRPQEDEILIPRITFEHALPSGQTLLRKQFPLAPAYAGSFNGCQGLTLDIVGLDLRVPAFSHGQLYTAISRIRNRRNGCVLLPDDVERTPNVTYQELLL